jgi:WD40 repeat protein
MKWPYLLAIGLLAVILVGGCVTPEAPPPEKVAQEEIAPEAPTPEEKATEEEGIIWNASVIPIPEEEITPTPQEKEIIWNASVIWEYKFDWPIKSIDFSSDGSKVVAIGDRYTHTRYDILYFLEHNIIFWNKSFENEWMHDVSICNEGNIVTAGDTTRMFDKDGHEIWVLEIFGGNRISISPDCEYVAVGTYDGYLYLLNKAGEKMWRWRVLGGITGVSVSRNGDYIVAGDDEGWLYLFDKEGNLIWDRKFKYYYVESIGVSISPEAEFIGVAVDVRYATGKYHLLNNEGEDLFILNVSVYDIAISERGDYIVINRYSDVGLYDHEGNFLGSFEPRESVGDVAITPDGKYILVGSHDMRIYLLEGII